MRLTTIFALSSLAILGCRSDSNNNNTDGSNGSNGSNGSGDAVTIQQVQNDAMAPGTPVSLKGVVVTAIDNFGAKVGDFWVEEPEGGPFSGVHVFKADPTQVAALAVGDIVDISGAVKDEFALTGSGGDMTGRTTTELEPVSGGMMTVTKTGTGTVPAPAVVDALTIGQMADADAQGPMFSAEWEKWEGVLITVNNVSALGAPKCIGSACSDPTAQQFGITGVAEVESTLAALPTGIKRADCLGSVTGVVDYFFSYLILPRSTADVGTGGTGCPAAETTCADSIDNDGNGFADCADNSCVINASATGGNPACKAATATISSIDTAVDANPAAPTLPTGNVEIDNVYVTAIAGTNFWIASSLTAGADSGLYVFGAGQPLPSGMIVGSKVNVIGKLQAYKAATTSTEVLPEVNLLAATVVTANAGMPSAATQTAATLNVTATGRPYVGSLVSIAGPNKVTAVQTMANHYTGTITNGATTYEFIGTIVQDSGALNTCYGAIKGVWTWDGFNNKYAILPTVAPTTGTGCP